uniref:HAD family hydrolase n=1 Tax=Flavobacterium sp. TaxID=239 RepID=UPI00404901B3
MKEISSIEKLLTIDCKHISFDLWLTLIKSHPEFKKSRNLLFKEFFAIDSSIEDVSATIRHYDVLCNNINEKTGLNLDTFEIYYFILSALGVDINQIGLDTLQAFYQETESLFMTFKPDLIEPKTQLFLKQITEQGKTVSILSNTAFIKGSSLRKLMAFYELESYFSFQIFSDETGLSKPNYMIFQLVYDEIKKINSIAKNEVLHLGDNKIADYHGALQFGFDAILKKI